MSTPKPVKAGPASFLFVPLPASQEVQLLVSLGPLAPMKLKGTRAEAEGLHRALAEALAALDEAPGI